MSSTDIMRAQMNPADAKPGADNALGRSFPSLSLRHLRRRHDHLGEETMTAQRKETPFNIAQHRFRLVSEHCGGR